MKKQLLLLLLFAIFSFNGWTQSISFTSFPTTSEIGTILTVNYKYTVATPGQIACNVNLNNDWTYVSFVGGDYLNSAAAGTDVAGTFNILIPTSTTPTANLTGLQNYKINIELKNTSGGWLAGDYPATQLNFTAPPNTWVGGTSSSWTDGSNWNNGVPDATMDVIIGTGTFQPIIASNVSIKSLKLNELTSLTVNSGNNITVAGAITNNGMMTIENNANLIQAGTTNDNTGNIIVKRNSNALSRLDYTSWSSPVSNASQFLTTFSPLTLTNRFYNYNEATNQYNEISSPSSTIFAVGSGYLIRMPNTAVAAPATEAFTGVFTGVPNNGTINKVITYNGSAPFGYNLVGNPYPSAIDAQVFITANTTNIESSLYFWRKTNGASGTAYATYNSVGSVATGSGLTGTGSAAPNGTIQVGQGFFVKAKSASNLTFTNAMRLGTVSTQFFKTKQVAKDRVWLNLTNIAGVFSQTLVGYLADATQGVDNYDAKYINDSPIALTSSINGEEYTIQGRPAFDASDVVALNFKTDADGYYTIALDHFDGVFATGQDVYLVDSKTGTETDLKAGSYTFNATAGIDNARFSLKYQKTLKVDAPAFNENSVRVYRNNGALYVNSGNIAISKITVFDIQGRLITEQKNVKATSAVINNLKTVHQVLIVKIVSEDNKEVTKKVVN